MRERVTAPDVIRCHQVLRGGHVRRRGVKAREDLVGDIRRMQTWTYMGRAARPRIGENEILGERRARDARICLDVWRLSKLLEGSAGGHHGSPVSPTIKKPKE